MYRLFFKMCLHIFSECDISIKSIICGWIPERPKGADCKSVVDDFEGSNPSPSIGEIQIKYNIAGWSSLEARRAHNPKVIGSNPIPATQCPDSSVGRAKD